MHRTSVVVMVLLCAALHPARAQLGVPHSIQEAEAEGAAFPRRAAPTAMAPDFLRPSGGTSTRKCVAPSPDGAEPGDQLRSGEFIIRGLLEPARLHARVGTKIFWLPLHDPFDYPNALLVRAMRIGHPDDAFRLAIADWAYPGRGHERDSGFPSGVTFPAAGEWLVIATAGDDWGCFVLSVGS